MDISLFLAQAFGLYFVIVGVAFLLQPTLVSSMIRTFSSDRNIAVIGGFITLFIGIPLVLVHTVWDGTWVVLVTVLVWLTFLKGVTLVFAPDLSIAWSQAFVRNKAFMKIVLLAVIVLGFYLIYMGFGLGA